MATPVAELDLPQITAADRAEARRQIHEASEQHWLIRGEMGYVVTRYEDCLGILRDARWYSALAVLNQMKQIEDPRMNRDRPSILSTEGEEHLRLRKLVGPAFTPKKAEPVRPYMREVIDGLIDEVVESGRCELVADICDPYPIPIICAMVGAPQEDWQLFSRLATSIFKIFDDDTADHVDEIVAAREELDEYMQALIDERRANPRDDLLTELIRIEEEGDRLSDVELQSLVDALILAGTDTTRNQLACAVAVFTQHPDQWALLAERPELAPRAAEESLRYLGAVRGTGRFASTDIEYRDVLFPEGTLVFPNFVEANRDETIFDNPESFDITAERTKAQLTFSSGPHFCLGASLARAELQEALVALATRLPDLRLDGEIVWKPEGTGIWGPARLPIAFTPGPRR